MGEEKWRQRWIAQLDELDEVAERLTHWEEGFVLGLKVKLARGLSLSFRESKRLRQIHEQRYLRGRGSRWEEENDGTDQD